MQRWTVPDVGQLTRWDKLLQLLLLHRFFPWWKFWQLVTVYAKGIHDLHQLLPQKLWQGNFMSAKWSPVPCVPKHRPWRNNRRISTSFFREKSRNISLHLATVGKFFILNVTYILSKCWKRKFKILWYVIAKPTRQPKFVPLNFVVLSSEVFDPTARL